MELEAIIQILREALMLAVILAAPVAVGALIVGLITSIFQAATQIKEETLTVVPKLMAIFLILMFFGYWMLRELVAFSVMQLSKIGEISHR